MTEWTDQRADWVRGITDADAVMMVGEIARRYGTTDENEGDRAETRGAIRWIETRGAEGEEWGHAGVVAETLGLWPWMLD